MRKVRERASGTNRKSAESGEASGIEREIAEHERKERESGRKSGRVREAEIERASVKEKGSSESASVSSLEIERHNQCQPTNTMQAYRTQSKESGRVTNDGSYNRTEGQDKGGERIRACNAKPACEQSLNGSLMEDMERNSCEPQMQRACSGAQKTQGGIVALECSPATRNRVITIARQWATDNVHREAEKGDDRNVRTERKQHKAQNVATRKTMSEAFPF